MNHAEKVQVEVMPALEWQRMPLHGRILIEASAGTGKTWNIGVIYLRLLLERDLRVEQILVTTFTDAAAQELRERLRRRLIEAERWLLGTVSDNVESVDENSLESYLASLCTDNDSRRRALRKIQLARADLDRAPISTIHALCQRIQRDYPLESGAAFASDKLFDEQQLLRECVEDFWRRRYLVDDIDPREASLLLKDGPEKLLWDLAVVANSPDARIESGGLHDLQERIAALRTEATIAELLRLAGDKKLYGSRRTALAKRLERLAFALRDETGVVLEEALKKELDDKFDPENVLEQEASDTSGTLNAHPLIRQLQTLRTLMPLLTIFTRGAVLADAALACRDELPRRAQQRHVLTFSMLIDAVYRRLCAEPADHSLADRLFEAFPVALIDEFQDTDQRQFAIFDRIYRERGTLVMIGDPKQAIYSFRGGDIAAYLRASTRANHRFSLATNYRSSRALVEAMNSLYGHTDGGFDHREIHYQPVSAAGRTDEKPYTMNGAPIARPLTIHDFRGEAVDSKGQPLSSVTALEPLALDDCANRIVELLNDPQQQIDGRRVTPGDIAVLLSTNTQIVALRARLVARGVPCVGSGRGNIFAGDVARDLELILYAVLHADDDTAMRGALATRLLGATLEQFNTWQIEAQAFEGELERFESWRALVRTRGVLALIEALLAERGTALLALPEGERVVTDLRHLGELLAAEESALQGLDGLYAWLVEMRQEGSDGDAEAADERQLRIESDARRVQLLTIHASKGLEFPIVFLPLIWRVGDRSGARAPGVLRYHDDAGARCIDLGSPDFIDRLGLHFREDLQERLRLLYVALTRAIHAVHVYWVDRGRWPSPDPLAWQVAAIDPLMAQARHRLGLDEGEASLQAMADRLSGIALMPPFNDVPRRYQKPVESNATRATQAPLPRLRAFQWLHSFSGLTRYAAAAVAIDDSGAADEAGANIVDAEELPLIEMTDDARLLALYPLRGPRFGDAVHQVLELARPGPVWPEQRPLLSTQLTAQAIKADGLSSDEALERVGRMVDRVRQSDLGDGLRLGDIAADQRIVEFEFQFPVRRVAVVKLRQLCIAHGQPDVVPASLDATTLNGMLTGFADLIVQWDGRFHVLDYKTNWLGARQHDYTGASLDAAMAEHHYPLQALLYTVALHRYLRQRMDGYTAERHLGESWYLFVRAIGLEPAEKPGLGVWRHRWPPTLIEALDDAFAGTKSADEQGIAA
ncbi:exodeoxyribonuclease V beta subunit [Rhodanobacter sp. ANJX3]|uniref:UvrD-helicase domain-containing protein n=1 Tax=Rhodanobacter sp. ANJX3 TaxID=2723083 RepID=UPI0017A290CA|nr:UvrD-helicase domain-containing protein [Rhodanobacter sp. ANJX3]MBB5360597.1 exodeoxyribonuclease V beta subunit [Rhodanobacter sp. ANJX3]